MRETKFYEKLLMSTINALVVLVVYLPFFFFINDLRVKKIILVALFFLYNLVILIFNGNRCVGMMVLKSYYNTSIKFWKHILYIILYTLSFSTLLIWIYFPFDVFLFNILFIQLPVVYLKGTTLHGYLAGGIKTMVFEKNIRK